MSARLRPEARATLTDFALIHARAGRVAPTGDPRPWEAGEVTPIQNVARVFGRSPVDAAEWYFPNRLSLDVDGASNLGRNAVTKLLGLRVSHRRTIRVPLYLRTGR